MDEWDKLDAQYSGGKAAPAARDPWADLDASFSKPQAVLPATPAAKTVAELPKREVGAMDRVKAGVTGVNRGFWADLAGLPADTVVNVVDLGKAAIGASYTGLTGKPASNDLLPFDRTGIFGTSDYLAKKYGDMGMGVAINNPNPEDSASRVLHAGGRAVGASVVPVRSLPMSGGRQALNAAGAATSGIAAGTAAEMTDDPALISAAGMFPTVVARGAAAATRGAVRGGEQGRKQMEQRITDLKNGGIDEPSVGLATGSKFYQGIENIASNTPGAVGMYDKARAGVTGGMQRKTAELAGEISPTRGALESGLAVQNDIGGAFNDRFKASQAKLYGKVDSHIPQDTKVPVKTTADALTSLTAGIDGAQAIGKRFINGRIGDINDALKLDTGLAQRPGDRTYAGEGSWRPAALPQLPYKAVSKLRSQVGKELASNSLVADVPRSQWKQLYGSLSQDIGSAAATAGPKATQAWGRANKYTKDGIARLEDLQTLSDKATPEAAHTTLANSLNAGPSVYDRVRNSVTVPTRQKFASTVVDDMGAATPGQQGAAGTDWSPRTFLTNYNKMDPKARKALFQRMPGGEAHAEKLADIAKAADMVSSASKVWANPSGTAANTFSRNTFLALVPGAFLNAPAAGAVAGGLGLNAAASKALLLNPKFVTWLAQTPKVKPEQMQAHIQRLIVNTRAAHDPELEKNVATYLESIKQGESDEDQ